MGRRRSAITTAPYVEGEAIPFGRVKGFQAMFKQCGDVHKKPMPSSGGLG
jgi:hypothetical protein